MKRRILAVAAVVIVVGAASAFYFGKSGEPAPESFFPSTIGSRWTYEIEIGDQIPLMYEARLWPALSQLQHVRGHYPGTTTQPGRKSFVLQFQVKQKESDLPEGAVDAVRISVLKDELGVFADATQVFWKMDKQPYSVDQLSVYSADRPEAPARSGIGNFIHPVPRDEAVSIRTVFFVGEPGLWVQWSEKARERLTFLGTETRLPGQVGTLGTFLRFNRKVESAENNGRTADQTPTNVDDGFDEDLWYAKDRGLVRLEQHVGGKTTMIWNLVDFSPGQVIVASRFQDPAADKLKGAWKVVKAEVEGRVMPDSELKDYKWQFDDDSVTIYVAMSPPSRNSYSIDASTEPKSFDMTVRGIVATHIKGIYKFEGDYLILCDAPDERPRQFVSSLGSRTILLKLKRE